MLQFFRNVGPRMSGPIPRDRFFILSRWLTLPGPGEGPRGPKTPKNRPVHFLRRLDLRVELDPGRLDLRGRKEARGALTPDPPYFG